ncbi:MAG: hypothetical protein Q7T61_15840 [Caulobacter sp.]|nr:hypothetical protein [Caulobacter sp.]
MSNRSAFWGHVLNLAILVVIALALHNLWPVWFPGTPRPWNGLVSSAARTLGV